MNKRKIITIVLVLIIVALIIYFISSHISISKNTDDAYLNYTPQEEISDEQERKTVITLYFVDKNTNQIKSEGKLVLSNELIKNPYKLIVEKILEGPLDDNLKSAFPENTRLIDASFTDNCVTLNFSEELLNYTDDTQKFNIINSLLNSLSQLTEVNSIKFLVNNTTPENLDQEYTVVLENT